MKVSCNHTSNGSVNPEDSIAPVEFTLTLDAEATLNLMGVLGAQKTGNTSDIYGALVNAVQRASGTFFVEDDETKWPTFVSAYKRAKEN